MYVFNIAWDDDPLLAAVLAQSQQEYIDNLKSSATPETHTNSDEDAENAAIAGSSSKSKANSKPI